MTRKKINEVFGPLRRLFEVTLIITLFKSITKFCGTDSVPRNILCIQIECGHIRNILWNIVNPTKHYYGSK